MIFSGGTILHVVEFPIFLLIFTWALQQCSAAALPVMSCKDLHSLSPYSKSNNSVKMYIARYYPMTSIALDVLVYTQETTKITGISDREFTKHKNSYPALSVALNCFCVTLGVSTTCYYCFFY